MGIKLLVLLVLSIGSIDGKTEKQVVARFLSVSFNGSRKYLTNCNMTITPGSNNQSIDLKARLLTKVSKDFFIFFDLLKKTQLKDEYKTIFSQELDMCRIMDGFMSRTVARLWAHNLKRYSNVPLTCPVPQGDYYLRKLKVDRRSIPLFTDNGIYMFRSQIYIKTNSLKDFVTNCSFEVQINL